ncbi:MAG: cupin domain-containing protein, partial [Victivallales bacterium]|nr:cupin domain-containing protein [Victivallales bacterium]
MSDSTDTSTSKQKPKKVGERLKESIERFLLMRGLTSKDIISMIDDVLANKPFKSNEEEDGDLRKIRERVALILEGLDETEIARIRKQVSLILKGKGVPSLTPLLFISRTLNVRLGTFLDGDSSKIENLRPAICRRLMVKDEVAFGDDDEKLTYHPLSMNKSGVSMEPYIIEMGTPTEIDKLMNDNEFRKKRLERHAGEEFIYVMKGRLVAQVGNETIMLDEGDSIYYHGYLPHHIFSNDRDAQGKPIKKTDILAVVYAPPLEDTLSIKQLNMNNRFGKTLMRLRQMMKLDIAEVSRRTGLKENVITSIEEGGQITSLMPLTRITQALGVRLWTIITNGLLRNY